jgi:hypothetical protein
VRRKGGRRSNYFHAFWKVYVDKSACLLIATKWFDGGKFKITERATWGKIPWKRCTKFLIGGFGLIQGWEGRPDVIYTRRIRLCTPQQHSLKGVAYQQ